MGKRQASPKAAAGRAALDPKPRKLKSSTAQDNLSWGPYAGKNRFEAAKPF